MSTLIPYSSKASSTYNCHKGSGLIRTLCEPLEYIRKLANACTLTTVWNRYNISNVLNYANHFIIVLSDLILIVSIRISG